jgi:hypothetical protein
MPTIQTQKEICETIPFTIASKIIKYLGINLRKETKDIFFFVFNRPKTNAVVLLDMGHTLRGECAREE